MIASVLGMNSVPSSSGALVGIDDRHGQPLLELDDGVVGVGQAEGQLPRRPPPAPPACCRDRICTSFASSWRKNSLAFSSPQAANRQAACVAVVPNSGLAMPHLAAPLADRPGRGSTWAARPRGTSFGVDDQHARPGGEAVPRALAASGTCAGILVGRRRQIGIQQPPLLQPQRVEDLVVPEHVAPRAGGLGNDGLGQPDGLGRFDVELGQHPDAGFGGEILQDRLGEFRVERRVDHDFRPERDQQPRASTAQAPTWIGNNRVPSSLWAISS